MALAELTKTHEKLAKKGKKDAAKDVKNLLDDYKKLNDLIEGGKSIENVKKQWKKMKVKYWTSTYVTQLPCLLLPSQLVFPCRKKVLGMFLSRSANFRY